MTQSTLRDLCNFPSYGLTCKLPADHPGPHYSYPDTTPVAPEVQPASQSPDDLFASIFGDALEGRSEAPCFYGLGDDLETVPNVTADQLDKAFAMVRLGEKWEEHGAHELLPELHRSTFFGSVLGDYVRGTKNAGDDPDGKAYYFGQLCLRLLSAGYLLGSWKGGAQ